MADHMRDPAQAVVTSALETARDYLIDEANSGSVWSSLGNAKALAAINAALAAQPPAAPVDLTNHHNALKCPYCNPKGLQFPEPHERSSAGTEDDLLWPPDEMADLMDALARSADRHTNSYSETAHLARNAAKTIRALINVSPRPVEVTPAMVKAVQEAKCFACGAFPYEDCKRHPNAGCGREFNGGSRTALSLSRPKLCTCSPLTNYTDSPHEPSCPLASHHHSGE